jgi:hypothetical protein
MKFSQWFSASKLDVWRDHYLRYKALKAQLRVIARHAGYEQTTLYREFHALLLGELSKVDDFYCMLMGMQTDKWELTHQRLNDALRLKQGSRQERLLDELKETSEGICLCLSNLYDFSLANYKAFNHLMFSIEKRAEGDLYAELQEDFNAALSTMSFVGKYTGHKLVNSVLTLKDEILVQVAIHFFDGNLESARTCLVTIKDENNISKLSIFTLGLFLGLCLMIVVVIAAICIEANLDVDKDHSFSMVFPMLRCLLLFAFYSLMQSFQVYIWNVFSIDYQHLLKYQIRVPPVATHLARGMMFSASFLVCFAWYISSRASIIQTEHVVIPDTYTPLVGWGVIFLWMFGSPHKWFNYSGRRFVTKILLRSMASPFTTSDFTVSPSQHVFFTDQLVSLVIPLLDLEYTFCFYLSSDKLSCSNHMRIIPTLVTFFPLLVRFLQCFRYLYEAQTYYHPQAINAGKYLSSIIVIELSYAYKFLGGQLVYLWVVAAFFSSCYSFAWDLTRDWGLLRSDSKYRFLRQKLVYKSPKLYYWAIVSNLVLRFTWILSISPNIVNETIRPELFTMILGMAEVFRRSQWNVLRMENEQIMTQERLGVTDIKTGIRTMSRPLLAESYKHTEGGTAKLRRNYSI